MNHKDLDVWKKSMDLVEVIYALSKSFPDDEKFGLTNQIRRASVSIPSNISEGAARKSDKEFIQFLYIALGSLSELETQYLIAVRLKYIIGNIEIENKINEVKRKNDSRIEKLFIKQIILPIHFSPFTSHYFYNERHHIKS